MSIKISVIVPVYNLETYIERCVQSICNQTYSNLEIILVNDGSKDRSEEILKSLAEKDIRIKVISKENAGVTKARISGIIAATGEWIGFVDGDDYIEPDMYERLLNNAIETGADISHCGYQMVFPNHVDYYYNSGRMVIQSNKDGLFDLLSGNYIEPGLCNKVYKRTIVTDVIESGKMDLSICNNEDLLMNFYFFEKSKRSVYEDFCSYRYIIREGSAATALMNEHKLRDPRLVFEILMKETVHDSVLQQIVKKRWVAQLITLATIISVEQWRLIAPYRKDALKTIRRMMGKIIIGNYSKKQKFQCIVVAIFPSLYGIVHMFYAKVKGLDRKYEVNK